MKAKRKEKLMKGFLVFFVCFCFIGFSETSQASEQEYREACDGGDPTGCIRLGGVEYKRGNLDEAAVAYKKSCDLGLGNSLGCISLEWVEERRSNLDKAAITEAEESKSVL